MKLCLFRCCFQKPQELNSCFLEPSFRENFSKLSNACDIASNNVADIARTESDGSTVIDIVQNSASASASASDKQYSESLESSGSRFTPLSNFIKPKASNKLTSKLINGTESIGPQSVDDEFNLGEDYWDQYAPSVVSFGDILRPPNDSIRAEISSIESSEASSWRFILPTIEDDDDVSSNYIS